jgi:hypothetical protein
MRNNLNFFKRQAPSAELLPTLLVPLLTTLEALLPMQCMPALDF